MGPGVQIPQPRPNECAGVAQLVEQLICNQQVAGSSPIASSTFFLIEYGRVPEWPKGADCKSVATCFGGSNPPSSTIKRHITFVMCLFIMQGGEQKCRVVRRSSRKAAIGFSGCGVSSSADFPRPRRTRSEKSRRRVSTLFHQKNR